MAAAPPSVVARPKLAGAAAIFAVVASLLAILITPDPEGTAAAGFAGWPRLVLYALAGLALGVTAPAAGLTRKLHPALVGRRAYLILGAGLAASVVVTLVNVGLLVRRIADPLGPPLWLLAMLLLGVAVAVPEVQRIGWRALWPRASHDKAVVYRPWLAPALLVLLLVIASLTRLIGLGEVPNGINPDEGDRAVTAFSVLSGRAPPSWFDSGWYFINMIYFRVLAASFYLFGLDAAGGRMLSAFAGIGFVATIAWIGVRSFGWRTGLLATAFATGLGITLQHSRVITEAGPTALLWALSIGGFLEGARTGRLWPWALAGLAGGLGLYFYPSARLWAVGAVLTVLVLLVYQRDRRLLPGIAVAALAALIATAPFLVHLKDHRDELAGRYAQTAVVDPSNQVRLPYLAAPEPLPSLFALQTERTLGMFDRYPDGGGHLPNGLPMFGFPLAQLTLVGAFYLLVAGLRDVRLLILSIWFWLGLSGVLLTVETPNVLRSVGMLPSLCFVLAVPLVDLVDRALAGRPEWLEVRPGWQPALVGLATAGLAVALIAPETLSYFTTYSTLSKGWGPANREGQIVATLGASGPVYSIEMNEHMVTSGWVRLLSSAVQRGRMPNPGRELPVLATTPPSEPRSDQMRPESVPAEGQGLSVVFSPDVNQAPYLSLFQQLYPGGTLGDAGDGRRSFQVSPQALAATRGVTLVLPDGSRRDANGFGELPRDLALPARLTWRAGVALPRGGQYRLAATAPGPVQLRMADVPLADARAGATVDVVAAPGLHFLELVADVASADQRVTLVLTDPDGRVRQLGPTETYRPMDAPWGLLARIARPPRSAPAGAPADAFLDLTVAMAFFEPELGFVSSPNTITWTGSLLAPRGGVYRMAFASEDPMRLEIDGRPADVAWVKPEQWQAVGTGSQVRLSEGRHTVRVVLEVNHNGRELARWNWVPPTASGAMDAGGDWSVVPPSVLRPDPPVAPASVVGR